LVDVLPKNCSAQIRYRQAPQSCILDAWDSSTTVIFDIPQRAITPGQVCALYDWNRVLWSGIIS
jgi:tRNA-specific 2-thiouridylase